MKDNETSNEIGKIKRFSRRAALRIFGGAFFGLLAAILINPGNVAVGRSLGTQFFC